MAARSIVVVGAGPCGLACARTLRALGHQAFTVLEAAPVAGGLAGSVVDAQGFTWDHGGHVVFSHYGEFDRLLVDAMGDELLHHDRSSFVHVAHVAQVGHVAHGAGGGDEVVGAWVPYPYQLHLHHLPPEEAEEALVGLVGAAATPAAAVPGQDFAAWMLRAFGSGITRQFMRPYNEKVWAHPPESMAAGWIAERVAEAPWRQALAAYVHRRDQVWGPNHSFAFPAQGGTGEIYRRAARGLGDAVRFDAPVEHVAVADRVVTAGGQAYPYDRLVWTGALDALIGLLDHAPDHVRAAAGQLVANEVTVVGIGYEEPLRDERSWLYFPEADVPFYRATNFAKYSPAHVPGGRTDLYSSWMTETAHSAQRPLGTHGLPTAADLPAAVDAALKRVGVVPPFARVASVHVQHLPRAYPVPTLGRDAALAVIQPWLMAHGIYSRGRFGAWRYELGNMDHAVKMGADVAHLLVNGTAEAAWA